MSGTSPTNSMRRIHIVGGPGSGKTVLARQLGKHLGIPTYELDTIAFEGRDFTDRPLAARLEDVRRIAAQPSWITEGIFLGWTEELMRQADSIVWLDNITWHRALYRITVRFAQLGLGEAQRRSGMQKFARFDDYVRNLRQLLGVYVSTRRYYVASAITMPGAETQPSRAATAQSLLPHRYKVIHCAEQVDFQALLEKLAIDVRLLTTTRSPTLS